MLQQDRIIYSDHNSLAKFNTNSGVSKTQWRDVSYKVLKKFKAIYKDNFKHKFLNRKKPCVIIYLQHLTVPKSKWPICIDIFAVGSIIENQNNFIFYQFVAMYFKLSEK